LCDLIESLRVRFTSTDGIAVLGSSLPLGYIPQSAKEFIVAEKEDFRGHREDGGEAQ